MEWYSFILIYDTIQLNSRQATFDRRTSECIHAMTGRNQETICEAKSFKLTCKTLKPSVVAVAVGITVKKEFFHCPMFVTIYLS